MPKKFNMGLHLFEEDFGPNIIADEDEISDTLWFDVRMPTPYSRLGTPIRLDLEDYFCGISADIYSFWWDESRFD